MNRLLCRILLAALLIAAAAAAFYFGYWRGTPNYAAGEIRQAVVNKDYQLFRERVDLRRVYGYALDDIAAEIAETGSTGERFASGFMKALKKPLVDELIRQTEKKFRQDAPESGSPLSVLADTAETYVGSAAISLTDIFDIREENGMTGPRFHLAGADGERRERRLVCRARAESPGIPGRTESGGSGKDEKMSIRKGPFWGLFFIPPGKGKISDNTSPAPS